MRLTTISIIVALLGIISSAYDRNFSATVWASTALIWMIVVLIRETRED
jgi:hypothetical protein